MAITTEMIKQLRADTGAGILECRKALENANGDLKAALDYLREKGLALPRLRNVLPARLLKASSNSIPTWAAAWASCWN